jgi:hypothetical protein
MMNRDFAEILAELSAAGADFLVVGAYALAAHEQPRATGDIDVWIRATPANARLVWQALVRYGAPLHELKIEDLAAPGLTFQMGIAPTRVDILTEISGLTFDEAWPNRIMMNEGPLRYPVIGKADLIRNKRAAARPKDLVDADNLERQ